MLSPLTEKGYKPLELPAHIPEESEKDGPGGVSSEQEHIRSVAKAFGKAINENISKIVPQKDVVGPYGQPLMLKAEKERILIATDTRKMQAGHKKSLELLTQSYQQLNQQVSRFKPDPANGQAAKPIKLVEHLEQTPRGERGPTASDSNELQLEHIVEDSLLSVSEREIIAQAHRKVVSLGQAEAIAASAGLASAGGPQRCNEDSLSEHMYRKPAHRQTPDLQTAAKHTATESIRQTQETSALQAK